MGCIHSMRKVVLLAGVWFLLAISASAQTADPVYTDSLGGQWQYGVWDCGGGPQVNLTQTAVVHGGTCAMEVNHTCAGGWGGLSLDRRSVDWSWYDMYPNQYRTLSFWINPGSAPQALANMVIGFDNGSPGVPLSTYSGTLTANTWKQVSIPVADIDSNGATFARIVFFNNGTGQPHYWLDDIVLSWQADPAAPVVSNVNVSALGPDTATVSWDTDELSSGSFVYTLGGQSTTVDVPTFGRTHQVVLQNLSPASPYTFRITARDHQISGSPNVSTHDGSFTTAPADTVPPVLSNVRVSEIHSTWLRVAWDTDEAASAEAQYGVQDWGGSASSATRETSHVLTLSGLSPQTLYQIRVRSTDRFGNTSGWTTLQGTTGSWPTATLAANVGTPTRSFSRNHLGANIVNWAMNWGRPYPNDMPKLRELTRLIRPGVIRHGGGLLSNNIYWDRNNSQCYPTTCPGQNSQRDFHDPYIPGTDQCSGQTVPAAYRAAFQADEIDNIAAFCSYVGADLMIEGDIETCDPAMWADMVRYANVEKNYGIRYWELGNELDLVRTEGDTRAPVGTEYVARWKRYWQAMKAVDPSIRIIGPTTAAHEEDGYFNPFSNYIDPLTQDTDVRQNHMLDGLTYHLYPLWNGDHVVNWDEVAGYTHAIPDRSREHLNTCGQSKRQILDQRGFTGVPVMITEFNTMATTNPTNYCWNHGNALYMGDTLGRLAAGGVDMICNWTLYDMPRTAGTRYGLIDYNNSGIDSSAHVTDNCEPMPAWYTYFLYAQFFGSQMVQSSSSIPETLSIWASTDAAEPGALRLMVTNLGAEPVQATIQLGGVTPVSGKVWQLTNPGFTAAADKNLVISGTGINGLEIDCTSPATIQSSARTILDSGQALTGIGAGSITRVFPEYSVTAIVVNPILPGDLNLDGSVNALDLTVLANYLAGTVVQGHTPFLAGLAAADLDGSGSVDAVDLLLLALR